MRPSGQPYDKEKDPPWEPPETKRRSTVSGTPRANTLLGRRVRRAAVQGFPAAGGKEDPRAALAGKNSPQPT